MPKILPQTNFFSAPSVIYAQINSLKKVFPACIGSVDDGRIAYVLLQKPHPSNLLEPT